MATAYTTVEIWVTVDQDGDYECGSDQGVADERFEENIGELAAAAGLRRVKLSVTVPLPRVIEIAAVVECDEADPTVTVS